MKNKDVEFKRDVTGAVMMSTTKDNNFTARSESVESSLLLAILEKLNELTKQTKEK